MKETEVDMKWMNNTAIVGVDNGYGNVKTANCCFPTGVIGYDKEPVFKDDLLVYDGKYYQIGEGHKSFTADKTVDEETYILTLAAIARELNTQKVTTANVHLAVGLPLTWVSGQKEQFKAYLLRNERVIFMFRGKEYCVNITGADVFPQGFAAIAPNIAAYKGTNMLCDIGNATMNIMFVQNRKAVPDKVFTEKFGTHQCMLAVKERVMQEYHISIPEALVTEILRFGTADIRKDILQTVRSAAADYVEGIFRILRDHEYSPELMKLTFVGGGGCLVKNFGHYDPDRVSIVPDICAAAKGYEYLAEILLRKHGG